MTAEPAPGACLHPENVIATMANGYIAFVSATPIHPDATEWPEEQRAAAERVYGEVIRSGYAGSRGFGSLEAWARAFGISQAPAAAPAPIAATPVARCASCMCPKPGIAPVGTTSRTGRASPPSSRAAPAAVAPRETPPTMSWPTSGISGDDGVLSGELDRVMEVVRKANRRLDVDDYYGRKATGPLSAQRPVADAATRRFPQRLLRHR